MMHLPEVETMRFNRCLLKMLAHRAILDACKAAHVTGENAHECIRHVVLDEKLAATVRVSFPDEANTYFEEIERVLATSDELMRQVQE
jgi:hypothetical protein